VELRLEIVAELEVEVPLPRLNRSTALKKSAVALKGCQLQLAASRKVASALVRLSHVLSRSEVLVPFAAQGQRVAAYASSKS
jgi:hypothetical protein